MQCTYLQKKKGRLYVSFNIDDIKHLGTFSIDKDDYKQLKHRTTVFPYVCSDYWVGQLSKLDDAYSLTIFCTGIEVSARLVDTDTGVVKLRLKYHDGIAETEKDFEYLNIGN